VQHFLTNFCVEFLVELDVTSTGCVALLCVAFCRLLRIVLWCLLLVTLLCWLKFLSIPVPSLHDLTQQLDGRTTVRPTWPLNKQNFHCVFFTGKHHFRGIFVITTFYVPSVALVKLAKISSLSLRSTFWWPFHMLKRIANLKGAP